VIIIALGALGGGVLAGALGIVVFLMINLEVLRGLRAWVYGFMIVAIPVWPFPGAIGACCRSRIEFAVDEMKYSAIMGIPMDLGVAVVCCLCVMGVAGIYYIFYKCVG
jgi:hypothetical protein